MKIAIAGPMCSGKSTLAKLICSLNDDYKIYSFGQKIKDIAQELFHMGNEKNRSLLINIANSMKVINKNVWIDYISCQCKNVNNCIIDDLRFENELNSLKNDRDNLWYFLVLQVDIKTRIQRIKYLYPTNYEDHIKNMNDISEKSLEDFPKDRTIYIDTNLTKNDIKILIQNFIGLKKT